MKLVRRREVRGDDLTSQLRRRIRQINEDIERLTHDRNVFQARLDQLDANSKKAKADGSSGVICPRCGRDHDFLTDADGYLAHVLEDPSDTELVTPGKPLFCPECGEVFIFKAP